MPGSRSSRREITRSTIYRHVTSGSSWGANPLQQTIGLAKAERIARLEIHWPTSGTTQVFRDIAADQAIQVTELEDRYRVLPCKPIAIKWAAAGLEVSPAR